MCAEAGIGRHSPGTFSRRCPAFLCGVPDEFFDESDHFFKKTAARSPNLFCLRVHEISGCLIQAPTERSPRLQGVCAEQLLYTGLLWTLATIKHVFDDGEYLDAQQLAPSLHGFDSLF